MRTEHHLGVYRRLSQLVFFHIFHMSIHSDYVSIIAECEGTSTREVERGLKPATLTLADANRYGFTTVEDYEEAIREYVYG